MIRPLTYLFALASLFWGIPTAFAQNQYPDSLLKLLKTDKEDTTKVNHLREIAWELKNSNPDTAILLTNQAMAIAVSIQWEKGIASCLGTLGVCYRLKADYPKSLDYFHRALKIDQELNDKRGIATRLGNIGSLYWNQADYSKALDYYSQALKLNEELSDKRGIATNLGNIGSVYYNLGDYSKAIDHYLRTLTMAEEIGNKQLQANTLGNIGSVYRDKKDYLQAMNSYRAALKLAEELGYKNTIALQLGSLGSLFSEHPGLPSPDGENQKGYELAAAYLYRALAISDSIGARDNVLGWYQQLSLLYERSDVSLPDSSGGKLLNTAEMRLRALYYYKRYIAVRDQIFNEDTKDQLLRKEMNFEFEKQHALAEADKKKQQTILLLVSCVLLLVFILTGFAYRSLRRSRKQNAIIEKQKEIAEKNSREKELLLKEIHHRVKNNLQVITSLLNLQSNNISDPVTLSVIKQAQVRVRSMALVHQKLYQAGNFSEIDFGEYLKQLTDYISDMYHDSSGEVECIIETKVTHFNIDTAIPLGLIITELLSNSYKYAFKVRSGGSIRISISMTGIEEYLLIYSDNGIGLPSDAVFENSTTLGLELVGMLTKQLQGTFNTYNNDGAFFEIRFKMLDTSRH